MKHLFRKNLDSDYKHRIVLILIGFLALNTLGVLYIVNNLRDSDGNKIAFGKASVQSSSTSKTDTINKNATGTAIKESPTSSPASDKSGGGTSPSTVPSVSIIPIPSGSGTIIPSPIAGGGIQPFPNASLCPDSGNAHNTSRFHSLWDSTRGCHFDHEHGQDPFISQVDATFPGFDLFTLLGNVGVAHTNHSSPLENSQKHGGFKYNVQLTHPEGCAGFEGARNGVNGSVIQYHSFGDGGIELEARVHSSMALVRQCNTTNPTDYGYIYTVQFQDYGQRIVPYQGTIMPYPNQPEPAYDSPRGPYISFDCVGNVPQCRASLELVRNRRLNAQSNWASKPTGSANVRNPFGSKIFTLLFRVSDSYRLLDWNDQTYPFTFRWICTTDNGLTYNSAGCRYTNSTTQVHEIAGNVPTAWDNLTGFDRDPRVGRVTANGYVSQFGDLDLECTSANANCFPIKMVNAFVGSWGSVLVYTGNKGNNIVPFMYSRDIFFCNGQVCNKDDANSVASGWIGQNN